MLIFVQFNEMLGKMVNGFHRIWIPNLNFSIVQWMVGRLIPDLTIFAFMDYLDFCEISLSNPIITDLWRQAPLRNQ